VLGVPMPIVCQIPRSRRAFFPIFNAPSHQVFEQAFKNIDDILHKDAGSAAFVRRRAIGHSFSTTRRLSRLCTQPTALNKFSNCHRKVLNGGLTRRAE